MPTSISLTWCAKHGWGYMPEQVALPNAPAYGGQAGADGVVHVDCSICAMVTCLPSFNCVTVRRCYKHCMYLRYDAEYPWWYSRVRQTGICRGGFDLPGRVDYTATNSVNSCFATAVDSIIVRHDEHTLLCSYALWEQLRC